MKILEISEETKKIVKKNNDMINVFYQFFVHKNPERQREIIECLKFNVNNKFISKIYLLNEKIYTDVELGINDSKIIQININKRLMFSDVYRYINDNDIKGYNVLINADIFFDNSIENLKWSDIHINKKMFALLRFEYDRKNIKKSKIFGPRFDSMDTWIIHSNFNIKPEWYKVFDFEFGKPGCDNKLIYLMKILGYTVLNDPNYIKTYHNHMSQQRDYTIKDVIQKPWGFIAPYGMDLNLYQPSCGVDLMMIRQYTKNFSEITFDDNTKIYNYILKKLNNNNTFIIPMIDIIENNYVVLSTVVKPENIEKLLETKNTGIKITSVDSYLKFCNMYLKAFENCELFLGWDIQGEYSRSHDIIKNKYNKKIIWANMLDIFHYIYKTPWTISLKGKRILIISPFDITEKIPIREKIYGIDLFPECEIINIVSQVQDIDSIYEKLDMIKDNYDIALVSCKGYSNMICNYIYENHKKSSIYVGNVLGMYFGIISSQWIKDRPDILKLFMNSYWSLEELI
jgi:hypothetical protein